MNKQTDKQKKKAIIYTRVSKRRLNASMLSQLDVLRKYAKDNNIEVVKEYQEVGLARKENRYRFQKMFKFIKENNIADILVCSTDRLTRNHQDIISLQQSNIKIHSLDKDFAQ